MLPLSSKTLTQDKPKSDNLEVMQKSWPSFFWTGNTQRLSFRQDPEPATLWHLCTSPRWHNAGSLLLKWAWITGAH